MKKRTYPFLAYHCSNVCRMDLTGISVLGVWKLNILPYRPLSSTFVYNISKNHDLNLLRTQSTNSWLLVEEISSSSTTSAKLPPFIFLSVSFLFVKHQKNKTFSTGKCSFISIRKNESFIEACLSLLYCFTYPTVKLRENLSAQMK